MKKCHPSAWKSWIGQRLIFPQSNFEILFFGISNLERSHFKNFHWEEINMVSNFSSLGSYSGIFHWVDYIGILLQEITLVHCPLQEVTWSFLFEEVTSGILSIGKGSYFLERYHFWPCPLEEVTLYFVLKRSVCETWKGV